MLTVLTHNPSFLNDNWSCALSPFHTVWRFTRMPRAASSAAKANNVGSGASTTLATSQAEAPRPSA